MQKVDFLDVFGTLIIGHFTNATFKFGADGVATCWTEEIDLFRFVQVILIDCYDATVESCSNLELNVIWTQLFETVFAIFVLVFANVTQLQDNLIRGWIKTGINPVDVSVSKKERPTLKFFILFK